MRRRHPVGWAKAASLRPTIGVFAALLTASPARAQDGGAIRADAGTGATGAAEIDITFSADGDALTQEEIGTFFSAARCACGARVTASIAIGNVGDLPESSPVAVRVGSGCAASPTACALLDDFTLGDFASGVRREVTFTMAVSASICASASRSYELAVIVDPQGEGVATISATQLLPVDTSAPPAPELHDDGLASGEGGVLVRWTEPSDAQSGTNYQVLCERNQQPIRENPPGAQYLTAAMLCGRGASKADGGAQVADGGAQVADGGAGAGGRAAELDPAFLCSGAISGAETRIDGLANAATYHFWVVAFDDFGNPSAPLDLGEARAVPTEDFYERYVRSGGGARGGFCGVARSGAAGARSAWTLLGVLALAALLLRGRKGRSLLVTLGVLGLADRANADEYEGRFATPQRFALELRFGPYTPQVDEEFAGAAHPYQDLFGDDSALHVQAELDWQFWKPFGSFGVGTAFGALRESAHAFVDDGSGATLPATAAERSEADETSLRVYTMWLGLVYRFDVLARRLGVPIVPFAKLGFDYYVWWVTESDGSVANHPTRADVLARGWSTGWQWGIGAALLLDAFDPRAAKLLDSDVGINHTYVFFEYFDADVDNFGGEGLLGMWDRPTLHLGDDTWVVGLAFEM
ncbi:MAG: MXAN_2562 family outer membrane beta-barrel protein [Myxococcota bacterium]